MITKILIKCKSQCNPRPLCLSLGWKSSHPSYGYSNLIKINAVRQSFMMDGYLYRRQVSVYRYSTGNGPINNDLGKGSSTNSKNNTDTIDIQI